VLEVIGGMGISRWLRHSLKERKSSVMPQTTKIMKSKPNQPPADDSAFTAAPCSDLPLTAEKPFKRMRELPHGETLFEMYQDAHKCVTERMMVEGADDWWVDMNKKIADRYRSLMDAIESGEITMTQNK